MGIFADYPPVSRENPFDRNAKGKYFAHLTNRRMESFSYLAENLDVFAFFNPELYKAMPMGYTNLWILERISVKVADEEAVVFSEDGKDIKYFYCVSDKNGEYSEISEEEYTKACSNKETVKNVVKIAAKLLENYYWH